jgi:glycosyltransferase involved in cell wall biosynthesis
VPCFNLGDYLNETLDSVIKQTIQDWECIIINDGSDDHTHEIALSYVDKDYRYKYIRQENHGLSASRNKGLQNAKGEFIQFLDADDLLSPLKLEYQIDAFNEKPQNDIVYSEYLCFKDKDIDNKWTYSRVSLYYPPIKDFILNWEKELSIPLHCFLFRMSCFTRWGQFDETLPNHEDWDLHIRFAHSGARYIMTPGRTSLYRIRQDSMARNPLEMTKGRDLVINKYISQKLLNLSLTIALYERKAEGFIIYLIASLKLKNPINVKQLFLWMNFISSPLLRNILFFCIGFFLYLTRTIITLPFKKSYTLPT